MSTTSNGVQTSNSTLPLFRQCPPGLGDGGCLEATCNSTFVEPAARTLKPAAATSCAACDAGFTGLNCNVCSGVQSCSVRQSQVGRGLSGVSSSSDGSTGLAGAVTINNTLTCDNQPRAIKSTFLQCNVNQPTFSALFPGEITITGIKVADVPNFANTGLGAWDAQANSSYLSVFLDGAEQFYCQATGCSSRNSTQAVQTDARWGTDLWSCSAFQCFCPSSAKMCNNPNFPLSGIINGLGGSLDFPCDFVDPSDPTAQGQCVLSTEQLNSFVGPGGLSLTGCRHGQCIPQFDLDQYWQQNTLAARAAQGNTLSGGVIAGLAILGAAVALLLLTLAFGYWQRKKATSKPRFDDPRAIGLSWDNVSFSAAAVPSVPRWARGGGDNKVAASQHAFTDEAEKPSSADSMSSKGAAGAGQILRGISSRALPGTLNFIIGPSGAGKSSLVDVLAGRPKRGKVQGSLSLLSDHELTSNVAERLKQRQIAVVDQDDSVCLPGYMTVCEMLSFAAELSLAENVTKAMRKSIVQDTLEVLGLRDIADQCIGDARTRGISGGERRRVSLGVAMVARPKILIADECTSGLDAFSAHRIVEALRSLASGVHGGTTVIATLHQPSSQIFDMADRVAMLSEGRILFDGPPSTALDFCRRAGVPVPPGHNVADHLLTYAFDQARGNDAARNVGRGDPEDVPAPRVPYRRQDTADGGAATMERQTTQPEKQDWIATPLPLSHGGGRPVTTFITQLHALTARSWLMTRREMLGAVSHIVGSAIVAVFTGACFYQVKLDLGGFQNRVGSMFFVFILLLFTSLSALVGLAKTRLLMMRERSNAFYSPWSWITAHLLYDLVLLRAIPSILIVCIVYWMVGLSHKASDFFLFMLVTVVFAWVTAVYNMLLAALIEEIGTAILLAGLFILTNLFLAGFIMSLNSMPKAVRWLRWVFPAKYALEAVASNELKGLMFVDTFAGVPVSTSVSLFSNKLFGFEDDVYYRNLIILSCGFLVGFSALLFAAVHWRMRELR